MLLTREVNTAKGAVRSLSLDPAANSDIKNWVDKHKEWSKEQAAAALTCDQVWLKFTMRGNVSFVHAATRYTATFSGPA